MTKDNRETIEIDLDHDLLFQLMLEAHNQDITLNQLVENILRKYIDEHEKTINKQDVE
jgi:predicted HicB family RNase H-like nuclease